MKAPPIVLKLKIGHAINMPTPRLFEELQRVSRDCDRARNAMFSHWRRWREDHLGYVPQQRLGRNGEPKVTITGTPVRDKHSYSQEVAKSMYRSGCEESPRVGAKLISSCMGDVTDFLDSSVPYDHEGASRFKWEAVMTHEISSPTYRSGIIPVPSQDAFLAFDGIAPPHAYKSCPAVAADLVVKSKSCVLFRFPLLSRAVDGERSPVVRLEVGGLPKGKRRWLRMCASGEVDLCDSKIVRKDRGWYLHLLIRPPCCGKELDKSRQAVLTPLPPSSKKPFELRFIDREGYAQCFAIGDGPPYAATCRRLDIRDRAIRSKYRGTMGAGHGRGRFYEKVKPISRAKQNAQDRFTKQLIWEIVAICIRENIGTLNYREPKKPLRDRLWFTGRGAQFEWATFAASLAAKCDFNRISKAGGRKADGSGWMRISVEEHRNEYASLWEQCSDVELKSNVNAT